MLGYCVERPTVAIVLASIAANVPAAANASERVAIRSTAKIVRNITAERTPSTSTKLP